MAGTYYNNKIFDKLDSVEQEMTGNEYDSCIFRNLDFSNCNFSRSEFVNCRFESCNLSLVKLTAVRIKNINFVDCKLVGVGFSQCDDFLFSASFIRSNLDYCYFINKNLKNTRFTECSIREANFAGADLSNIEFNNCDFSNTVFEKTILERTNFTSSFNYSINPEQNKLKKTKFSVDGLRGLLDKYDIIVE